MHKPAPIFGEYQSTNQSSQALYSTLDKNFPLTDSHCHLILGHEQDEDYLSDLLQAHTEQDIMLLDIGIDPKDYESRLELTEGYPTIFHTLGMHPCQSAEYCAKTLVEEIEPRIHSAVAIGEIGLDWYRMYAPKALQTELFIAQIKLAQHHKKPIIIHARESLDDIIEILASEKLSLPINGIMHCFSGNALQAKKCMDMNFYISFAANISYQSAQDLREVCKTIPSDFLLTETDSPYLLHRETQKQLKKISKNTQTNKKRHSKVNSSLYLFYLYRTLASIRNTDVNHIAEIARDNLRKIIG